MPIVGIDAVARHLSQGKNVPNGELYAWETFWRDHQPWLKDKGYLLRPRYRADWTASWLKIPGKTYLDSEDGLVPKHSYLMDATRAADGMQVMLKRINLDEHPDEIPIALKFSTEPLASNSKNHCAPLLEVLDVPGDGKQVLLVMPFLHRFDQIPFVTVGEAVDFFQQIFEGLQFMHNNQVSHCDCKFNNIMMDGFPLYLDFPHPIEQTLKRDLSATAKYTSRTIKPVRYYFIDFGFSKQYNHDHSPLEEPPWGGDHSVPEFAADKPCNPFPVDVYCLGNVIRTRFMKSDKSSFSLKDLEFMKALVDDMVQEDPQKRPTIDEVVRRFHEIQGRLSMWKLRSRLAKENEPIISGVFRSFAHWTRQVGIIVKRVPPIPRVGS